MAKLKTFHVHHADEIPPVSENDFRRANRISDYFPAKIENQQGETRMSLVTYDFKNERWCSPISGVFTMVEYYSETTINSLSDE